MTAARIGAVLYEGPSKLDGAPIVAIANGFQGSSVNDKTGKMIQTWILRSDISPVEALRGGEDFSVCGNCQFRFVDGNGLCLVNVGWGPQGVWKAYKDGRFEEYSREKHGRYLRRRHIRIGSYGDPVAVPSQVWRRLIDKRNPDWTGYTHQWRLGFAKSYRDFLMASVESQAEVVEAESRGWRPFLVLPHNRDVPEGFSWCPADSLNPARKVECTNCLLCSGIHDEAKRPNKRVAIYAHGTGNGGASFGMRGRQRRLPVTQRKKPKHYPLVRMEPALHAKVKALASKKRLSMRAFVGMTLERALKRQLDGIKSDD